MKRLSALIAATIVTVLVGAAIFTIGANAMTNKDTVPMLSSPNSPSTSATSTGASSTGASSASADPSGSQVQQLQGLVGQYQQREQQYQDQINQLESQLQQENSQIQAFQQLLSAMQNRGLIFIEPDGRILLPGR